MPKNVQTTSQLHYLMCQQGNAQNPPSQASTVCEPRTFRCTSQIQKRQRNQRQKGNNQFVEIKLPRSWIIEKAGEIQKNIYFCFIGYTKAFDCVNYNKLWKRLKDMEIPDHLTLLLRNLYAGQEATVRIRHGTADQFKIGNGVHQGCILSPCLFNLHAEYIMQNVRLDESQAGIKIARRNINNLRYAVDTTLMAESEEELKSLLMKVKEESEKAGLKLRSWYLVP